MRDLILAGCVCTAVGNYNGVFKGTPATELGAAAIRESLVRTAVDPATIGSIVHRVLPDCMGSIGRNWIAAPYKIGSILGENSARVGKAVLPSATPAGGEAGVSGLTRTKCSISYLMQYNVVAAKLKCPDSAKLECHTPRV